MIRHERTTAKLHWLCYGTSILGSIGLAASCLRIELRARMRMRLVDDGDLGFDFQSRLNLHVVVESEGANTTVVRDESLPRYSTYNSTYNIILPSSVYCNPRLI